MRRTIDVSFDRGQHVFWFSRRDGQLDITIARVSSSDLRKLTTFDKLAKIIAGRSSLDKRTNIDAIELGDIPWFLEAAGMAANMPY